MKLGMTRWKEEPLKPNPFSPVHRARKFSAVFGTTSARSWNGHMTDMATNIYRLEFLARGSRNIRPVLIFTWAVGAMATGHTIDRQPAGGLAASVRT
jgi:hypothetical protein